MDKFNVFEKDVIENILSTKNMIRFPENELASKILKQYKNSTIVSREFTGVGFFTYFQLNDKSLSLGDGIRLRLAGVHAEVNDLKHGAGFWLEVENGIIDNLEGFCYEENWPKKIKNYKLSLVNKDGTLTEL